MAAALIALGSNLGDRQQSLDAAVARLSLQPNVVVLATSRWSETKPVGGPKGQSEFLNGAVLLGTSLTPQQLQFVLRQIETAAGRTRESRWAPRTLDLDLLLYDDLVIDTPELTVPHPRMSFRRFVLEPAAEVAPAMRHPTIGWTIAQLRNNLPMPGPNYLAAVAGPICAGKTRLVGAIADSLKISAIAGRIIPKPRPRIRAISNDRSVQGAIELLRSQSSPLFHFRIASKTISDYWLAQTICLAEMTLPQKQLAEYVSEYNSVTALAAKPKLLVHIDVPPDVSWQRIAERGDPNPPRLDWLARYRELLLKRVGEPGHGPVLRLDGTKPDEAKDELVAAIQAMR